ncbi:MAG TPA: ATP-binding protein [Kiritimatiellia bacterium]|nr:ATP-binding protein [Kiritimatiellia bacterium]HRZ12135.1 ATP-binding protein [Kiritimatiellia bacterium]HSA18107.1 ATP-binding protein [Kiritimatiellia bacterium]
MTAENKKETGIRGYVTLHVPCRYSYLRVIRQAVLDLCARAGMTEFKSAQLEMAVDESCSNIIEHGYAGESEADLEPRHPGLRLNLIQHTDRVIVEILDRGKAFDFNERQVVEPDQYLEDERERGLGMYIIKRFVDEAEYEPATEAGNCLRLMKRIR